MGVIRGDTRSLDYSSYQRWSKRQLKNLCGEQNAATRDQLTSLMSSKWATWWKYLSYSLNSLRGIYGGLYGDYYRAY